MNCKLERSHPLPWTELVALHVGLQRAAALGFGAVQQIERLDALDLHYHARNAPRPLPVWRLRFEDEARTWVHATAAAASLSGASMPATARRVGFTTGCTAGTSSRCCSGDRCGTC
jgi:hypothetical protein